MVTNQHLFSREWQLLKEKQKRKEEKQKKAEEKAMDDPLGEYFNGYFESTFLLRLFVEKLNPFLMCKRNSFEKKKKNFKKIAFSFKRSGSVKGTKQT